MKFSITRQVGTEQNDSFYFLPFSAFPLLFWLEIDAHQGAGHADHISENGAEFAHDPLSFSSGPITRLRAKRFKEALNGLVQEIWADSRK